MYKIDLEDYFENVYFVISRPFSDEIYNTSKSIAKLFDMTLDECNDVVIEKIINSSNYTIRYSNISNELDIYHDLMFETKKHKKFYIEKFKEVFAPQLMLLTMER